LEVQTKKASYLKGSYSPIKQRQGEIMDLRATYQKEMATMGKALDEFNKKWKEQGDWSEKATEDIKAQGKAMEESMRELTIATERELKKKQFPIWNDLVEASNQWADGFTDALSEIINGVDSVTEALDALQKQILQDTLKIIIKRTVTDNLQDMLGDEGSIFGFKGLFGGGKKGKEATEITAKKPIPVHIVKMPENMLESSIPKMEASTLENIGKPIPVYVTNMGAGGMSEGVAGLIGGTGSVAETGVQGVSQDLADISKEIAANTEEAAVSSESWLSKIKSGFSSIGSWLSGLFNSGGSGAGGGASGGSSWWSSLFSTGASAASAYYGGGYSGGAMAEGGVIREPVIGKGLKSGEVYNFGEKTKYGEPEIVAPMKKLQRSGSRNQVQYHMPVHISAIDTQSGIEFLMRHSDVIQGQLVKSLKQNKPIRKGIQNSY
jgi:hypothetical protein